MIRRPPRSTRTATLFPYTTLFRSRYTWSLAEASTLGDSRARNLLLDKATIPSVPPSSLANEFDRVLGNPSLFRASQMNWDGYGISENDLFVHPRGLWREHGVQQFRDPRIKALLRRWALDNLPHELNSPETRQIVAAREARVERGRPACRKRGCPY